MILKCPSCLRDMQTESDLEVGQHLVCSICGSKFVYYPQKYIMPEIIMSGIEFEEFLCRHINGQNGMRCVQTKASGDQGVDLIVEVGGGRVAIQCKLYSSPVGNDAVQQVIAGRIIYKCDVAMVVTNATFTSSAEALAKAADVHLVNYKDIIDVLEVVRAGKTLSETNEILYKRALESGDYKTCEKIERRKLEESPSLYSAFKFLTAIFEIDSKIEGYLCSSNVFKVFALFYVNLINVLLHISKKEFALATIGSEFREEIELSIILKWYDLAGACFELANMSKQAGIAYSRSRSAQELLSEKAIAAFEYSRICPERGSANAMLVLRDNFIVDEKQITRFVELHINGNVKYEDGMPVSWINQIS